jgi:chromosome segregation protein
LIANQKEVEEMDRQLTLRTEQLRIDEKHFREASKRAEQKQNELHDFERRISSMQERLVQEQEKQDASFLAREREMEEAELLAERRNSELQDREFKFWREETCWRRERTEEAKLRKLEEHAREARKKQKAREDEQRRRQIGSVSFQRPSGLAHLR